MNWNVITYAQNIHLSLWHKCVFAWVTHNIQLLQHYLVSVVIELNLCLWTKSCLMLNCVKFYHIIHDTISSMHQQVPCILAKMISLGSRPVACCKLAPTLARQMWRHNYVIYRNEYLIFTLSESISPRVYSLQFLFKSTYHSWRYERKCESMFFSNT